MSPETFLNVLNVGLSPECQRRGFTFKTFPMLLATTASNVPKKVPGWISKYTNLSPQVDSDAALAWNLLKEKQDHLKPLCHAHFAVNDLKHSKALVKCFSFCTFGDAFPICEKKKGAYLVVVLGQEHIFQVKISSQFKLPMTYRPLSALKSCETKVLGDSETEISGEQNKGSKDNTLGCWQHSSVCVYHSVIKSTLPVAPRCCQALSNGASFWIVFLRHCGPLN